MDITIIVILGLLLIAVRVAKLGDIFSPWTITIGVWLILFILFLVNGDILYPLGEKFYGAIALWIPIFCVSSVLTYLSFPPSKGRLSHTTEDVTFNRIIFKVLFWISMVITPIYVYRLMQIVSQFDAENVLFNIRMLHVFGEHNLGFLQYSYIINQALFVVAICQYRHVRWWQMVLIIIANLLGQFAIMEKSGIFFLLIATLFVLYEKRVVKIRTIGYSLLLVVGVFYGINKSMELSSNGDGMPFLEFFGIYVMSAPVAFEYIQPDLSHHFGSNTFSYFYLFLNRFGITNVDVVERLQEFVFVPLPTNTFTILEPFYKDWQNTGVAYFAFIYGVLSGFAYRQFRNGSLTALCIYAYFVRFLILQFYHEDFMHNIVHFIQFCFFVFIMTQHKFFVSLQREKPNTP